VIGGHKLSSFAFILTDACNWQCAYCYQKKGRTFLDRATLEEACEFFFPFLTADCWIQFYGGEPLLAWDLIQQTVNTLDRLNRGDSKKLTYSITTNGSLLTPEVLNFLKVHSFHVLLSFDVFAQEEGRKRGTQRPTARLLESLLRTAGLAVRTNSVFTPLTVGHLERSLRFLCEAGVPDVQFQSSLHQPWDRSSRQAYRKELTKVRAFLVKHFNRTGTVPVQKFRRTARSGLFSCAAGLSRLALAPDGKLWGCYLLADYFRSKEEDLESRDFCFGHFEEFFRYSRRLSGRALAAHRRLRAENFFTSKKLCAMCDFLEECGVCPAGQAIFSGILGLISSDQCWFNRVLFTERRRFWKEAGLEARIMPQQN
jgi:sulfatase maturation enzyme AslB (radical SAM superfamily)